MTHQIFENIVSANFLIVFLSTTETETLIDRNPWILWVIVPIFFAVIIPLMFFEGGLLGAKAKNPEQKAKEKCSDHYRKKYELSKIKRGFNVPPKSRRLRKINKKKFPR